MSRGFRILDTFVWLLFCGVSLQLGFLQPFVILVPGERTNLFSGILCAGALVAALLVARRRGVKVTGLELLISLGLVALGLASAGLNSPPWGSTYRVLVLLSSGLGGFWCARILLNSEDRVNVFAWLCTGLLLAQATLGLWGYHLSGQVERFIYTNPHPVIGMMFLLIFGPLFLMAARQTLFVYLGAAVLAVTYATLFAAGVQVVSSGMLVPLALVIVIAVLQRWGSSQTVRLLVIVMVVTALSTYFVSHLSPKSFSSPLYQAYRIESYPFSWHIAEKRPLFGIGLRSPREEFLADYSTRHPHLTKDRFRQVVSNVVTHENAFLTLMTGVGIPFLLLYVFALAVILSRLVRLILRDPQERGAPAWVLIVPLLGGLMHSLVVDTLLYPQIAWYFHILLGLVPRIPRSTTVRSSRNLSVRNLGSVAGAMLLGIILGTHPALSPERLPNLNDVRGYVLGLPVIKPFFGERVSVANVPAKPESVARPAAPKFVAIPRQEPSQPAGTSADPGRLTVNVHGVEPWAVMVILDNSPRMLAGQGPSGVEGREIAWRFFAELVKIVPADCALGLRMFFPESVRRKDAKLAIRVSRLVWGLDTPDAKRVESAFASVDWQGQNNLCSAAARSARADFAGAPQRIRRIALITDDPARSCDVRTVSNLVSSPVMSRVLLDVIAVGMALAGDEEYSRVIESKKGNFVRIAESDQTEGAAHRYVRFLQNTVPTMVDVVGKKEVHKTIAGASLDLSPGLYSVIFPPIQGLQPEKRIVEGLQIAAGTATTIDVYPAESRVQVENLP